MLHEYTATITTHASLGTATVYIGSRIRGYVVQIKYDPGSGDTQMATGADLDITGETSGVDILHQDNVGTSVLWRYPQSAPNKVANGDAITDGMSPVFVMEERIKVVVDQGGNANVGTITVWVDEEI